MVWWIHDKLRWIWVCAVNDVSHFFPQPHPTTFNPTLSHNMYCHLTRNTQQHHYHTTPGKWCYNTSTIQAKCLAEHCAGPEKTIVSGGGGGGNYYHNGVGQGAAPGCVLGGGGGIAKMSCYCCASHKINFAPALKKSLSGCGCGCVCVCVCVCVRARGVCVGGGGAPTYFFRQTNKQKRKSYETFSHP